MADYKPDKVTFIPSPLNNGECIPKITMMGDQGSRDFRTEDMARVMDLENMPMLPPDAPHGHLEFEMDDDATVSDDAPPKFPKRFFCLRGCFIFYFDMDDVDTSDRYGTKFNAKPLGVIPLERTTVEFPQGGRRVFREHAKTEARYGYEMMIRHLPRTAGGVGATPGGIKSSKRRAPAYLVCESSGIRHLWKEAIEVRSNLHMKDTKLRAAGTNALEVVNANDASGKHSENVTDLEEDRGTGSRRTRTLSPSRRIGGEISVLAGVIETGEQNDINEALEQFGNKTLFDEAEWVNAYFESHDESEGKEMCTKLEKWQSSIKKGLRGAVLEQYEYFVEASREMTILGREVAALKEMGSKQVEIFETMKRVNFDLDFIGGDPTGGIDGTDTTTEDGTTRYSSDEDESESEVSSGRRRSVRGSLSRKSGSRKASEAAIKIPEWLEDVVEEIGAFVSQCRYTDATELLLKAKVQVTEIINSNEKLTEKKLSKKEFTSMQRTLVSIEDLSKRLCERLVEGLRRKNDALKQISKKERADPLVAMAPSVSPIALNDDSTALHLLVKLGRGQDAASAYATRRSLLLNECLHERPICNTNLTNNVDVIIYAAQISHSFFNALSISVEGFLDLFSDIKGNLLDDQSDISSINTGTSLKSVPPNALAATCLWCDSELLKFASAFGSKVLGNLMLSPREGGVSNKITDKITKFEVVADLSHLKEQLRAAEEMGEYVAAGKLRKKIAIQEEEEKSGKIDHRVNQGKKSNDKERIAAIEIASKCIDQAFEYASEFLNTIGLPLTPRLAEYLRTRLKGTEAEIAVELEEKWDHIVFDWKSGAGTGYHLRSQTE